MTIPMESNVDSDLPPAKVVSERRNFWTLGLVQITVRTGWIFKTESIIIPVVLDTLSGAAWMRGFLPMFSRSSYSLAPWLLNEQINGMPKKKWALSASLSGMAICFLGLAMLWMVFGESAADWMPFAFLVCYAAFFVCAGTTQLCFGTLQGKLVPARRRGRLMLLGNVGGAGVAISAASLLLPLWLESGDGKFHLIFAISAVCFLAAACIGGQLAESPDNPNRSKKKMRLTASWHILCNDSAFRRAAFLACLFGTSFVLFPHYQALARVRLQIDFSDLIFWVIVQNAGTAVVSLVAGFIADARGNRLVLRLLLFGLFLLPGLALYLTYNLNWGRGIYWGIFLLLGLVPVTLRTLQNYTLELVPGTDYPRYLSTLGLCIAAPMMVSPLVGLAIDRWGFDGVFLCVSLVLLVGWFQTFLLAEPRHTPMQSPMPSRLTVES